jgi:methionyl-tRNA synthetase
LGNLVQRTLSFIYKNCGGVVPNPGAYASVDTALLAAAQVDMMASARRDIDRQRFDLAIASVMDVVIKANAYIDEQAPWSLRKTDPARMNTVLYVLAETIRCLGLAMQPFTPTMAGKILDQLGVGTDARSFAALSPNASLTAGSTIPEPQGVFPRLEASVHAA